MRSIRNLNKQQKNVVICKSSVCFCLASIVFFLLDTQSAFANSEEKNDCILQLNSGKGFVLITSKNVCQTFVYEIEAKLNTSIITIALSPYDAITEASSPSGYPNHTAPISTEPQAILKRNIIIVLEETSIFQDGTNTSIVMGKWHLTEQNFKMERFYLSRTSQLRIQVTISGSWTEEGVKLSYADLKFNVYSKNSNKERGTIASSTLGEQVKGRNYRPHSVSIFQIKRTQNMNISSISIILNYLDIDEGIGEYLLIGAGENPFSGPPPLFLSNKENKKKSIMINDENAYILFVARSTRKAHTGFNLAWRYNGTKISIVEEDILIGTDEDVLQSIQVCIYNYKAALKEFQKPEEIRFIKFREELAVISSEVAKNHSLSLIISSSKITFYRISTIDSSNEYHEEGLMYVMLKIQGTEKGKAAFSRALLQESFNHYNSYSILDEYRVGQCPTRKFVNSGFYAMIPILCSLFLFIWIWRQKKLSVYFTKKQLEKDSIQLGQNQDRMSGEDNIYSVHPPIHTIPKMQLTDVFGRRLTLDYNDTVATYVEEDSKFDLDGPGVHRRSSRMLDEWCAENRRTALKEELNEAFEDDEENEATAMPVQDAVKINETENVYDSLKPSKSNKNASIKTRL